MPSPCEVQIQPLKLFLLPRYLSPSQFSCILPNELSKLTTGEKLVILLFSTERLPCIFRGASFVEVGVCSLS